MTLSLCQVQSHVTVVSGKDDMGYLLYRQISSPRHTAIRLANGQQDHKITYKRSYKWQRHINGGEEGLTTPWVHHHPGKRDRHPKRNSRANDGYLTV